MEDLPDFIYFVHFEKYIVCNVGGLRSPSVYSVLYLYPRPTKLMVVVVVVVVMVGLYWIHLVRLSVCLSVRL